LVQVEWGALVVGTERSVPLRRSHPPVLDSHAVAALEARLAIPGLGFIVLDGAAGASRERAAWRTVRPAAAESFAKEEGAG
jgi:hypothetical protein